VLLAAREEYEERKLEYTGRLLASFLFDDSVSQAQANWLVHLEQSLTYRQLCALTMYSPKRALVSELPDKSYIGALPKPDVISTLAELYALMDLRLVQHSSMVIGRVDDILGPPKRFQEISPSRMALTPLGMQVHYLMELGEIPWDHVRPLVELLSDDCAVDGASTERGDWDEAGDIWGD
jgi:hypothetical protein